MSLAEKVSDDVKSALKSGDKKKLAIARFLSSELKNFLIKENLDNEGLVIGVDLKKIETIDGTFFIHKSITELKENDFEEFIEKMPFDLVLSDIAPNISGIKDRDNALMIGLVDRVLFVIDNFLKVKGSTVIKVFHGESMDYTSLALKKRFNKVKISKPKASRPNSKEIYLIGKDLK